MRGSMNLQIFANIHRKREKIALWLLLHRDIRVEIRLGQPNLTSLCESANWYWFMTETVLPPDSRNINIIVSTLFILEPTVQNHVSTASGGVFKNGDDIQPQLGWCFNAARSFSTFICSFFPLRTPTVGDTMAHNTFSGNGWPHRRILPCRTDHIYLY